jgi:hypothetical protein
VPWDGPSRERASDIELSPWVNLPQAPDASRPRDKEIGAIPVDSFTINLLAHEKGVDASRRANVVDRLRPGPVITALVAFRDRAASRMGV